MNDNHFLPAHTPGPWEVRGCELIGQSTVLATLYWHSGRGVENDADAALTAAPPDLLAALVALESAFTNPYDDSPYEDGEVAVVDAARAAIALAAAIRETPSA